MKKHAQKKSPPAPAPSAELPLSLPAAPSEFCLRRFATAAEMRPLTGLSDPQLRNIERQLSPAGAPWIPPAVAGRRDTIATLRGLAARAEHLAAQRTPDLDQISFSSMESCEAILGIPKTLQQLAKTSGCTAFRGSRIYLQPLSQWIHSQAGQGQAINWEKMNPELDAKLKHVKLQAETGKYIQIDEAHATLRTIANHFFNALRRLEMEAPREFEMRPRQHIKTAITARRRQVTATIENELKNLEEKALAAATADLDPAYEEK